MKAPKEDIYIEVLKFGKECGISGDFKIDNLFSHLAQKGYINEEEIQNYHNPSSGNQLSAELSKMRRIEYLYNQTEFQSSLHIESYFNLLEWEELSEARKNANEARALAIAALIVSSIGTLAAVCSIG